MQTGLTFDSNGLLPIGDHEMTLRELSESVLVTGPLHSHGPWDAAWRLHLVNNLRILVEQLWHVGITNIFIDGSFVEEKAHPNDIDGYFECDLRYLASGRLAAELNQFDRFGPGVSVYSIPTQQRHSYQCGISIMLNCIQSMDNFQES